MPYQYVRELLHAEESDRLSNACETPTERLVWTLLDTGLRVSELCDPFQRTSSGSSDPILSQQQGGHPWLLEADDKMLSLTSSPFLRLGNHAESAR
jgi:hypothetical protein